MSDTATLVLVWLAGGIIGLFFFCGLWWTVRKGVSAKHPGLWFFGSMVLRISITLAGFYGVSNHHLDRLLVCLLGFFIARLIVTRLSRIPENSACLTEKIGHAP